MKFNPQNSLFNIRMSYLDLESMCEEFSEDSGVIFFNKGLLINLEIISLHP